MDMIKFYLTASSKKKGAMGIHHVYADETVLARSLDARTGARENRKSRNSLQMNELRYGWLRDAAHAVLDEVMLARPVSGMRVLMTHGGGAVRTAVTEYLEREGFVPLEDALEHHRAISDVDILYDTLLSSCVTEAQAAAILEARSRGDDVPVHLLTARRVILAGPPNAGKSSLMNSLAGYDRAFVHAEAGATRDVVDELVDIGGYAVWIGDLPGYSGEEAGVGKEAWRLASPRLAGADCILFVVDGSREWGGETAAAAREVSGKLVDSGRETPPVLVAVNKTDLSLKIQGEPWREYFPDAGFVAISCLADGNAREVICRVLPRLL